MQNNSTENPGSATADIYIKIHVHLGNQNFLSLLRKPLYALCAV